MFLVISLEYSRVPRESAFSKGQPLGLVPVGSVMIGNGVHLLDNEDGSGSIFIYGMAAWFWSQNDVVGRRLAAVQLDIVSAATSRDIALGFGISEPTLWRWRDRYLTNGIDGLEVQAKGPKRPSKLTPETISEIRSLREQHLSFRSIAEVTGVSYESVRRALESFDSASLSSQGEGLVALAKPSKRTDERIAARRGLLTEAKPEITQGSHLPLVGSLVVLPALDATGLIDAATSVYGAARTVHGQQRSAFYGLRSLILSIVFSCLVGEPRAEGSTRIDPVAIGRLLGLDRAPETKRLRVRMAELADEKKADQLLFELAKRHTNAKADTLGIFYTDGHVRAYHGDKDVSKAHVTRMRIAMPAEIDTWITDRFGDGVLVWQAPPGASLSQELRQVTAKIRALVGEDRRPMICFDRGGWSPKLFAELSRIGFDILTYRKGPFEPNHEATFSSCSFVDELGRTNNYLLADETLEIPYNNKQQTFLCRQITRMDAKTAHLTQIITTDHKSDKAALAYSMFSRWRQENFFRYMRMHYALDALDSYESMPEDMFRLVANPERRLANAEVKRARASIEKAQQHEGRRALAGVLPSSEVELAFSVANSELERLVDCAKATATKVPLGELHPDACRLDPERKRIIDAIKMATYNAESALSRLISPYYARAQDEARSLLREVFRSAGDLEIQDDLLHVRINPLSSPRRTRALAAVCEDLTAQKTTYPGTALTLVYSVKD